MEKAPERAAPEAPVLYTQLNRGDDAEREENEAKQKRVNAFESSIKGLYLFVTEVYIID